MNVQMEAKLATFIVRERRQLNLHYADFICIPKIRIVIYCYELPTIQKNIKQLKGNKRPRASIKSELGNPEGNALTKAEFSTETQIFPSVQMTHMLSTVILIFVDAQMSIKIFWHARQKAILWEPRDELQIVPVLKKA